jgi:uncharacterized protein
VELAIISDTHIARGERRLPEECIARLRNADLILHAGDLVTLPVLAELQGYGEVVAVHGNVDDLHVRQVLPERRVLEVDGARIGVVHDAGAGSGRLNRMRRLFPGADAVVFGHSHIPLHERAEDGFQIFNPGSPTERRRAPRHTMGMATVRAGNVAFELLALD